MDVLLSAAISADGYLDDATPERLRLSSDEDWAAVRQLRAECDAILVGAETVRKDNPSLREAPLRVVVSRSGSVPADARIFGSGEVLVLAGRDFTAREIITELEKRSVRRLMVEGGAQMLKMFLEEGMADRLRLAVAPVFVGGGVRFPSVAAHRMVLEKTEQLGQMAIMQFVNG
jgi:5-amino-6-(5-phosphoribosylamino)uracil reductase